MTELYIMAAALIVAGLYISYQYSVITRYRNTLAVATYALEAAYIHVMEGLEDDKTDTD